jgi:hypothetical protein
MSLDEIKDVVAELPEKARGSPILNLLNLSFLPCSASFFCPFGGDHFNRLADTFLPRFGFLRLGNPFQIFILMWGGAFGKEIGQAGGFEGVSEIRWCGHAGHR